VTYGPQRDAGAELTGVDGQEVPKLFHVEQPSRTDPFHVKRHQEGPR
jgi:hypothetical protein